MRVRNFDLFFNTIGSQECVDTLDRLMQVFECIIPRQALWRCQKRLLRICLASSRLPSRIILDGVLVSNGYIGSGASCSVQSSTLQGGIVAVKRISVTSKKYRQAQRDFIREAMILQSLSHQNVMPFIGVMFTPDNLSIVMPLLGHGDLRNYLVRTPSASKITLVRQIAQGLKYLKSCGIIHGDLKGSNILIDDDGNARIADYGLATYDSTHSVRGDARRAQVRDLRPREELGAPSFRTLSGAGTSRWMSPERLWPRDGESARPTYASDIFSYAMVIYEIYSGQVPFHAKNNCMADLAIITGQQPARDFMIPDALWELARDCWDSCPLRRPDIGQVNWRLERVKSLAITIRKT